MSSDNRFEILHPEGGRTVVLNTWEPERKIHLTLPHPALRDTL